MAVEITPNVVLASLKLTAEDTVRLIQLARAGHFNHLGLRYICTNNEIHAINDAGSLSDNMLDMIINHHNNINNANESTDDESDYYDSSTDCELEDII